MGAGGGVPPPARSTEASGELDSKVESKVAEESLTASVLNVLPAMLSWRLSLPHVKQSTASASTHSVAAHA